MNYTHRIKFYVGRKIYWWNCISDERCREIMRSVMSRGIENKTKGGAIKIIPPWCITRIEIKSIHRRGKTRETVSLAREVQNSNG